jgi:hypothetical protein
MIEDKLLPVAEKSGEFLRSSEVTSFLINILRGTHKFSAEANEI